MLLIQWKRKFIFNKLMQASKKKKKQIQKRQLPEFSFNFFFAYVSPFCQFLQKIKKDGNIKNKKEQQHHNSINLDFFLNYHMRNKKKN
jgi:hypothetical protein